MRLTKAMRETAQDYIVEKAYPSSKIEELKAKVVEVLDADDEWKLRKKLAEQYPTIVHSMDRIIFRYDDHWNHSLVINLDKPVATTVSYNWNLSYREDRSEAFYTAGLEAIGQEIYKYATEVNAYKNKVKRLVMSCNTTKQLYDAIPEVAGYFGEEEKKRSTALAIPQDLINDIRARIPQEEKA